MDLQRENRRLLASLNSLLNAILIQYAIAIVCPFQATKYRFRSIIIWGLMNSPFAQQAK